MLRAQGHAGHRTDIYSLGIVFYEMVTGQVPFTATSAIELLTMQIKDAPAAPSEIRPDLNVHPVLELAILRCLRKKMDERFQRTDELAEALRGAEELIDSGCAAPAQVLETLGQIRSSILVAGVFALQAPTVADLSAQSRPSTARHQAANLVKRAVSLQQGDEHSAAIPLFAEAYAAHPDPVILFLKARSHLALGHYAEARDLYHPAGPDVHGDGSGDVSVPTDTPDLVEATEATDVPCAPQACLPGEVPDVSPEPCERLTLDAQACACVLQVRPYGAPCDDGAPCTRDTVCDEPEGDAAGACVGGFPLDCDPSSGACVANPGPMGARAATALRTSPRSAGARAP